MNNEEKDIAEDRFNNLVEHIKDVAIIASTIYKLLEPILNLIGNIINSLPEGIKILLIEEILKEMNENK